MAKKKAAKKKTIKEQAEVCPPNVMDLARAHLLQKGKAFVVAFENDAGAMEICMYGPRSRDLMSLSGMVTIHAQGMALAAHPGIHDHFKRAMDVSTQVPNGG